MPAGISPISSSSRVPPVALTKSPCRELRASVNAPRTWPKSSLSRRFSWHHAAQVLMATKGAVVPRAPQVERLGDEFLPVPLSRRVTEDGRVGLGHARHRGRSHICWTALAVAEDVAAIARRAADGPAQDLDPSRSARCRSARSSASCQLLDVERLDDEIVCARAVWLRDRGLDVGVRLVVTMTGTSSRRAPRAFRGRPRRRTWEACPRCSPAPRRSRATRCGRRTASAFGHAATVTEILAVGSAPPSS